MFLLMSAIERKLDAKSCREWEGAREGEREGEREGGREGEKAEGATPLQPNRRTENRRTIIIEMVTKSCPGLEFRTTHTAAEVVQCLGNAKSCRALGLRAYSLGCSEFGI